MQNTEKTTLVIGASSNPERYSNKAIRMLKAKGVPVRAQGLKTETIEEVPVYRDFPYQPGEIHTVTLYLNPQRQAEIISTVLALKPSRIIFNPGTENETFRTAAEQAGIETTEACTLVMLASGIY